jgi:hypothetical protein
MSKLKHAAFFGTRIAVNSSNYRVRPVIFRQLKMLINDFVIYTRKYGTIFKKLTPAIKILGDTITNEVHRKNLIELGKAALDSQEQNLLFIEKATACLHGIVNDKKLIQDITDNSEIIEDIFVKLLKETNIKEKLKHYGTDLSENDIVIAKKLSRLTKTTLELINENTENAASIIDKAGEYLKQVVLNPNIEYEASKLLKKVAPEVLDASSNEKFAPAFDSATSAFSNSVFSGDLRLFGVTGTHFSQLATKLKPRFPKNEPEKPKDNSMLTSIEDAAADYLLDRLEERYLTKSNAIRIRPPTNTPNASPKNSKFKVRV